MLKFFLLFYVFYLCHACETNNDCNAFQICSDSSCEHKDLLPNITLIEIFLGFVFSLSSILSAVAGAGVFVFPLLILVLNFSVQKAAPLSVAMAFFVLVVRTILVLPDKSPYRNKPIINYNIALVFTPPILIGSIFGSMINVVSSAVLILVILVIVMTFFMFLTVKKGLEIRKQTIDKSKIDLTLTKECEDYLERIKKKIQELNKFYLKEEENAQTETLLEKENSKLADLKLMEIKNEYSYSFCIPLDDLNVKPNFGQLKKTAKNLDEILNREKRLMDYEKVGLILLNLLLLVFFEILRGTDTISSLLDVDSCGVEYWILNFLYLPVGLIFMMFFIRNIFKEHKVKLLSGYVFHKQDIQWDSKTFILILFNGIVVGVISAILGVGGAMISSPLLLRFGLETQEASYTASYLGFLSVVASSLLYFIAGVVKWDYALFYAVFTMSGAFIGLKVIAYLKKVNMLYVIPFALVITMGFCAVLSIISNVYDLLENENSWDFHYYCKI